MRHFTLLLLVFFCLGPATAEVEALIFDYPHGEDRIHVSRDGATRLYYAALPQATKVRTGTITLDELYRKLKPHFHPNTPREDWPDPQATRGMVTLVHLDGSEETFLIFDQGKLASDIFNKAKAAKQE